MSDSPRARGSLVSEYVARARRGAVRAVLLLLVAVMLPLAAVQTAHAATPVFTSATSTTFTIGITGTFSVVTVGPPTASLTESGALPLGVTFVDNGNGTATLAGRVVSSLLIGTYPLVFTANNHTASNTTQNFTLIIALGALAITVPSTASLGSAAPSGTINASLGTVQVTDTRNITPDPWTVTVTATSFTTGGGTTLETIPTTAVSYWAGSATSKTGTGTFSSGQPTASDAVVLSSSRTAFTHTAGISTSSAGFNPTLIITVPAAAVAGTYTGTITHSVA